MFGKDRPAAGTVRALLGEAADVTVHAHTTDTGIFPPGSSMCVLCATGSGFWRAWDHSGLWATRAALARLMGGLRAGRRQAVMCLTQHTSQMTQAPNTCI